MPALKTPGILIQDDPMYDRATFASFHGGEILIAEYNCWGGEWVRDQETGVYLSYEAFDRLVEAVREQRVKEAEAAKENP